MIMAHVNVCKLHLNFNIVFFVLCYKKLGPFIRYYSNHSLSKIILITKNDTTDRILKQIYASSPEQSLRHNLESGALSMG